MSQVLVVDLAAALDSPPADLLEAVRTSAEQVGVIQVVNHGVPPDLLADYWQRIERFFSMSPAGKAAMASHSERRYQGSGQPSNSSGPPEFERYNIVQFDSPDEARAAGVAAEFLPLYSHPNVWPSGDPEMRAASFRYIDAAVGVAGRVLGLYGRALGLPAGTFALGQPPYVRFTINNYPPGRDGGRPLLRVHRDDSAMTILCQRGDYEGLRVQLPDESWTPVPVVPGALIAMSGLLLTRWTCGRLRAPAHCAVAGGMLPRRSTTAFCFPGLHTFVQPVMPGEGAAEEPPFRVWDHTRERAVRNVTGFLPGRQRSDADPQL